MKSKAAGNLAAFTFYHRTQISEMLYLLWSLINLGMFIWFVLIAFSVLKLVRQNLGMVSTIVFIVGVLSFTRSAVVNDDRQNKNLNTNETVNFENLEKSVSYNLDLMYVYKKDTVYTGALPGKVLESGIISGHSWEPALTRIHLKNQVIDYYVAGTHQWKLLGLVLYNENKTYKGRINIK